MTYSHLSLRRRTAFLSATCLGLVVLADWLFYKQPIGWTASVYALVLLAAVTLRNGRYLHTWPGRLIALGIVGLAVSLLIEPGVLAVGLGLLGLVTLAIIDRGGWTSSVAQLAFRWMRFLWNVATQPAHDAQVQRRWQQSRGERCPSVRAFGRWVVPAMLSLIFVSLFALANPIISNWLGRLPENFGVTRLLLWLLVAVAAWGLLRVRLRRSVTSPAGSWSFPPLGRVDLILRCLILFNVVFAVQTLLDVRYLWAGDTLPEGMTYAEYAHRGAYPLVATALLAGLFALVTFGRHSDSRQWLWPRRLCYLWIAQNVFLLVSAVYRLGLYVEVYSLTRWRIAATIWMSLVAIGLLWLIWRIVSHRDNRWLLQVNAATAAAVLFACCFINFDGLIADYNVRHCKEAGAAGSAPIDLAYLEHIGPEALPALAWLEQHLDAQSPLHGRVAQIETRLRNTLHQNMANWRGWTLLRYRLRRAIAAV